MDWIIRGATVVDGTGGASRRMDVGIAGDRIEALGDLSGMEDVESIDGSGKILCPGFIDVHSHADLALHLDDQAQMLESLVRQGITTVVGGNCGMALAPLAGKNDEGILDFYRAFTGKDQREHITWHTYGEYFDALDEKGTVLNAALLAPHGIIRLNVMGQEKRYATKEELQEMEDLVQECMDAGALGLSTGLQYFPGSQSDTNELIDLAKIASREGGVFTSHLRSYSNTLERAIEEVKEVARAAQLHGQISHLFWVPHVNDWVDPVVRKAAKVGAWIYDKVKLPIPLDGAVAKLLSKLDDEINAGLPMGLDAMPTAAGFTHLLAFFPPWVLEKNIEAVLARIADPVQRRRMLDDILNGESVWPHTENRTWSMNFLKLMGWDGVYVMSVVSEKNKHLEGKHMKALGKMWGKHPFDAACDLLLEENGQVLVFETFTHPNDEFAERTLFPAMRNPNVSIVTDAIMLGYGRPSHLFYDCYPKYISKYIRDTQSISLEKGIRKCTSLPAEQLQIKKRGTISEGNFADLVLFDMKTIGTKCTFENPRVFPTGIEMVAINGKIVVDVEGYHPEPRAGSLIRRSQ